MARHHSGRLPHYRSRGAARYTKELDGQEDRLAALRKEAADRKAKRNQLTRHRQRRSPIQPACDWRVVKLRPSWSAPIAPRNVGESVIKNAAYVTGEAKR